MSLIEQVEFCASGVSRSQIATILRMLLQARGQPVSAFELAKESGSLAVHSRICDIRKLNYDIRNTTQTVRGKRHSFYHLVAEPPDPPPKEKSGTGNQPAPPNLETPIARQEDSVRRQANRKNSAPSIAPREQLSLVMVALPEPPKWHDREE